MGHTPLLSTLTEFLAALNARFPDIFAPHRALGAIVGALSAPVEIAQDEILELVLNQELDSAQALLDDEACAGAWHRVISDVIELMNDETWLYHCYGPAGTPPGLELAQWCDGYLQAYWFCEDVWQELYSVWAEIAENGDEEAQELANLAEFHPVLINMLFLLAHWDTALEQMDNLEQLPESADELFTEIAEGVVHFYGLMREMSASIKQASTPLVKPDAPNRNDPCPCGSGKKYKKCCLN